MVKLNEVLVPVVGFPNYEVSNYGRVVNVVRERDLKLLIHTPSGLQYVQLYRDGVKYSWFVHRLVARTFFMDYTESIFVDFINGDKFDCCVLNLTLGAPRLKSGPDRGLDGH